MVADTGRWLANRSGAPLALVHVAEVPENEAEAVMTSIRVRLSLGTRDDVRVLYGSPAAVLGDIAGNDDDVEFLVVGSRGRGLVRSAVLGSVSLTLATSARCPVVVVPPTSVDPAQYGDRGAASIVCGVDGSDHAVAAARLAGELAQRLDLRLDVVHALPDVKSVVSYPRALSSVPPLSGQLDARTREAEQIVDAAIRAVDVEAMGIVEPGPPWEVLESVADREAACLLVVASRGHTGLRAAVLGSVVARLSTSSRRPVVVLPEPAERRVGDRDTL